MSVHPLTYKPSKDGGLISAVSVHHPEDVLEWRKLRYRELGYVPYVADFLAFSRIDLHEMEDLLDAGCPHELATAILVGTTPYGDDPTWGGKEIPDEPDTDEPADKVEGVSAATEA